MMNKSLQENIGNRLGNVDLLPDELKKQLVSLKPKEFDEQILSVLSSYDGVASIDEIMVGLYRQYGRIEDRNYLANKLYRMMIKGKIESVKRKRGIYTITKELQENDE